MALFATKLKNEIVDRLSGFFGGEYFPPVYDTQAAGEAGTATGEFFLVGNGDDPLTYTRYQRTASGSVEVAELATSAALAASGGSLLVGWIQAGANAVLRTVYAKLREVVSPEDFFGTDTVKCNAALATGKAVRCSSSSYAITASLAFTASNQIFDLNSATLTCIGNFNLFTAGGGIQGCRAHNGMIEAAAMTGGYVASVSNADRITFSDMIVLNPFNFAFVEQANVVEFSNVWTNNIRGDYGIRWVGDATKRSDILRLIGVNLSFNSNGTGIEWDGNCHTLQAFGVTIVQPNKGIRIINTAGATAPEFGFFTNIEIDFPVSYGVEILAGESHYFGPQFYCHGSVTASGVYVAPSIPVDTVVFAGGKISGNATYGIENNTRVFVSNLVMSGNTDGDYLESDDAVLAAPRFELDSTFFFRRDSSGNPQIGLDANDTIGFNRAANDLFVTLASATRFQVSADDNAVRAMVGGSLVQFTAGVNDSAGTGFRALRVPNA